MLVDFIRASKRGVDPRSAGRRADDARRTPTSPTLAGEPLGLIAGNGRFPFLVAQAARRAGRRVVAVAIREEAAPELERRGGRDPLGGPRAARRGIEVLQAAARARR